MTAVLVISPESWDAHFVSKHHYAMELARRGHDVLFHGPPTGGATRLEKIQRDGLVINVLYSPSVAPGLSYWPSPIRNLAERRWLEKIESTFGRRIDVVWLFENSRFYDLRFAGDRIKIYHQVDLSESFHPKMAARTADAVFCTSDCIAKGLKGYGCEAKKVQHGVPVAIPDPGSESRHFKKRETNVVYVGNLSISYLDRVLIEQCVARNAATMFHMIGGFNNGDPFRDVLQQYPNVMLHGKIESARVINFLVNADVLMLCYQQAHCAQVSNPHKLMEYMASGRTVVATYTDEYKHHAHLLAMSGPEGGYMELFDSVLSNLNEWNSEMRINERKAFAIGHTYERQLDKILVHLEKMGIQL